MKLRTHVVALPVVCALAFARPADAQPKPAVPTEPSPSKLADSLTGEAKADYEAAKRFYGFGDNAGALVKFWAAYDKSHDARLLWNIAACEKNLHRYAKLIVNLRRYLREGKDQLTEFERADAESLIAATLPLVATLQVNANENGARVLVDDDAVGETPLPEAILVDVGGRVVRVEKEGFAPFRAELKVGDAPSVVVNARLERVVRDAAVTVFTSRSNDQVWVDGQLRGLGTWTGRLASGAHTLRVTAPGMRSYDAPLVVQENETRKVAVTLEPEAAAKPAGVPLWARIGGGALIVAGAFVVGYFLLRTEDQPANAPVGTLDPGSVQASFPRGLALPFAK